MRVDLEHRIIELEDADFRFDIPLIKGELPKGQTFLGTVVEAIPVFNIDSYEAFEEIRYSDYSFNVYKDGKYLHSWFGCHNLDSECLLDWQVEKVETGYKVINGRGTWNKGDIIPFSDIRVLDDHYEMYNGEVVTVYIAKKPNVFISEFYGNGSTVMCSTLISSVGIEPNKARFEESPNYYRKYFTIHSCGRSWTIEQSGVFESEQDFIDKTVANIVKWQEPDKITVNDGSYRTVYQKEVA